MERFNLTGFGGRSISIYTASFSSLAGRKAIFLLASIFTASPVAGFRPIRAGSVSYLQDAEAA
jgi:hypothetical protein